MQQNRNITVEGNNYDVKKISNGANPKPLLKIRDKIHE